MFAHLASTAAVIMANCFGKGEHQTWDNVVYVVPLVLVGDAMVGKSSIMKRFAHDEFDDKTYVPTVGLDFAVRTTNVEDKLIKLQCWDSSGTDRFFKVARTCFRGAKAVLLVFDVTSRESFDNCKQRLHDMLCYVDDDASFSLIANKTDLKDYRVVSREEGERRRWVCATSKSAPKNQTELRSHFSK